MIAIAILYFTNVGFHFILFLILFHEVAQCLKSTTTLQNLLEILPLSN